MNFFLVLPEASKIPNSWMVTSLQALSHYSAIAPSTLTMYHSQMAAVLHSGWYSSVSWIHLSDRDLYKKQLFTIPYPWKTNPIQTVYRVCNRNNKNGAFTSQSPGAYKPQGFFLLPTSQEGNFISFSPVALCPIKRQKIHFQGINTIITARRSQVDTHTADTECRTFLGVLTAEP